MLRGQARKTNETKKLLVFPFKEFASCFNSRKAYKMHWIVYAPPWWTVTINIDNNFISDKFPLKRFFTSGNGINRQLTMKPKANTCEKNPSVNMIFSCYMNFICSHLSCYINWIKRWRKTKKRASNQPTSFVIRMKSKKSKQFVIEKYLNSHKPMPSPDQIQESKKSVWINFVNFVNK